MPTNGTGRFLSQQALPSPSPPITRTTGRLAVTPVTSMEPSPAAAPASSQSIRPQESSFNFRSQNCHYSAYGATAIWTVPSATMPAGRGVQKRAQHKPAICLCSRQRAWKIGGAVHHHHLRTQADVWPATLASLVSAPCLCERETSCGSDATGVRIHERVACGSTAGAHLHGSGRCLGCRWR